MTARKRLGVLVFLSTALFVVGLFLPMLTIEKLVFENTFSVLSGILALAREGSYGLAIVLFLFSVIFPAVKLAILWLVWSGEVRGRRRERLLARLHAVGKWSMLDVFVVALTIVSVKLGALATAEPRPGIYVFTGSVLLSMIATVQAEKVRSQ